MSHRYADSRILLASCQQTCVTHTIAVCTVKKKKTDDGQSNCPKHVEFYSKNKFEKLVCLVGFIIRVYNIRLDEMTVTPPVKFPAAGWAVICLKDYTSLCLVLSYRLLIMALAPKERRSCFITSRYTSRSYTTRSDDKRLAYWIRYYRLLRG